MKKNVVIIILTIIILALISYIVYDKLIIEENKEGASAETNVNNDNNSTIEEQKDSKYFDEYLKYFLPKLSAGNFIKNIDKFNNDDISTYLYFYYYGLVSNGDLKASDNSNELFYTGDSDYIYYTISKKELDKVVYKYFGITDYEIVESKGRSGIKKIDNETYQVYWFPTSWMVPTAINTGISDENDNVVVTYKIVDVIGSKIKGDLIFYLTYNNGNYNVNKIEYIEDNN